MSRVVDLTIDSDEETPVSSDSATTRHPMSSSFANGLYPEHGRYIPNTSPNKRIISHGILDSRATKRRHVDASSSMNASVHTKTAFYHRIYPRILARARAHRTLPTETRSRIVEKVARELSQNPLMQQMDALTLSSSTFDGQIKVTLEKLVDKHAEEYHRKLNQLGATVHSSTPSPAPGSALASMKRTVTRPAPMTKVQLALTNGGTKRQGLHTKQTQNIPASGSAHGQIPVQVLSSSEDDLVQAPVYALVIPNKSSKNKRATNVAATSQSRPRENSKAMRRHISNNSRKQLSIRKVNNNQDAKLKSCIPIISQSHSTFSEQELAQILTALLPGKRISGISIRAALQNLLREAVPTKALPAILKQIRRKAGSGPLIKRSDHSIITLLANPSMLDAAKNTQPAPPTSRLEQLLVARSRAGDILTGDGRKSIRAELKTIREDTMVRRMEWSDCSGDLSSFAWTESNGFICGAVAHSDDHNQQYNKPGNLLFGAVSSLKLQSIRDHRIKRPLVESGDNALWSMRQSQDPWLYSSVTSISVGGERIFTSSYDGTVKVWSVKGASVKDKEISHSLLGTWNHSGNVNFVQVSSHGSLVATAADTITNAIRVYDLSSVSDAEMSETPYRTYSGNRANEQSAARRAREAQWAYHVATLAWGQCEAVQDLLLVGYSPRSLDPNNPAVPEEKACTGELCLWNVRDQKELAITSAKTQNVFEAIWHPSQPIFVAATSPCGEFDSRKTKTQIRLFRQTEYNTFTEIRTLDCSAMDINEITVRPNSRFDCYVTASCTTGSTFVWDTGFPDRLLHELKHGECIDELDPDLSQEEADVGVKFSAWGNTVNRFYTGSSDGVVKAWDITAASNNAFVRDVVILSGGVSAGAFSPDFEHLLIGDASGKVHLLSINGDSSDNDAEEYSEQSSSQSQPFIRCRAPISPFSADQPLDTAGNPGIKEEGREAALEFLRLEQLVVHDVPYMGVVQGRNYASTGLFEAAAHKGADPDRRLIRNVRLGVEAQQAEIVRAGIEAQQAELFRRNNPIIFPTLRIPCAESSREQHEQNCKATINARLLKNESLELGIFDSSFESLDIQDIFSANTESFKDDFNFEDDELVDHAEDIFLETVSPEIEETQASVPELAAMNVQYRPSFMHTDMNMQSKGEVPPKKRKVTIKTLEAIEAEHGVHMKQSIGENSPIDWGANILFNRSFTIY